LAKTKKEVIKLVIADDHPLFRAGVKNELEKSGDIKVIGEAGDGATALKMINEFNPDAAILDIEMPEKTGLNVAEELNSQNNTTKLLLLTMYNDRKIFLQALDSGVMGYVLKDEAINNITRAVKSVADGKYYLSPELSGFLKTGSRNRASTAAENDLLKTLTPAELNIIKLTSELKSNNEIAEILFISKRTVENHRVNIANKLDLGSAKKLLKFAVKNKDLLG